MAMHATAFPAWRKACKLRCKCVTMLVAYSARAPWLWLSLFERELEGTGGAASHYDQTEL